jgi:hypothetical protein
LTTLLRIREIICGHDNAVFSGASDERCSLSGWQAPLLLPRFYPS